jgi:hypothetical protein
MNYWCGEITPNCYENMEEPSNNSDAKAPAKTRNCAFWLINVLFSDEMSPKFEQLGRKNFWQEVAMKYKETNDDYSNLEFIEDIFLGIDPSVKQDHSWSTLHEIFKGLTKPYAEIHESAHHDDFINFVGSKSELYYLYWWLQDKPQLEPMVVINLPEEVFFDSGKSKKDEVQHQPSPTTSELSFVCSSIGRNNLVASINSLVEEHRKSMEPRPIKAEINRKKLEMQISYNYEDNMKRLIDVKHQLETENNPGIIKV